MFESSKYQQMWTDIKQFARTRFDLFKVDFLEKAAKIVGLILFALALILLLFAVISFGCIALIFAIGQALPMWAAALIVVALWLVIMVCAVVFRTQLFINPMLAAISAILFADQSSATGDGEPMANGQQPMVRKEVGDE